MALVDAGETPPPNGTMDLYGAPVDEYPYADMRSPSGGRNSSKGFAAIAELLESGRRRAPLGWVLGVAF
jgi:hypothetical protein